MTYQIPNQYTDDERSIFKYVPVAFIQAVVRCYELNEFGGPPFNIECTHGSTRLTASRAVVFGVDTPVICRNGVPYYARIGILRGIGFPDLYTVDGEMRA